MHDLSGLCADVDDDMSCNPDMLFSEGSPVGLDPASGISLGQVSLEDSPQPLRGVRASLTFQLPVELAPGTYHTVVCAEPCAPGERTSTWPSTLHVGIDPPEGQRPVRAWPLDDPAIEDLPDDALLLGHDGDEVTAAAVRAEARVNDVDGSQRVETAAPPAASSAPGDDHTQITPWIVGAALVAASGWAVSRVRGPRKRIRPGP